MEVEQKGKTVLTDADVTVQTCRDDGRCQANGITDGLPGELADALVRQGKGELALERVHEQAIHEVGHTNQDLRANLEVSCQTGKRNPGKDTNTMPFQKAVNKSLCWRKAGCCS